MDFLLIFLVILTAGIALPILGGLARGLIVLISMLSGSSIVRYHFRISTEDKSPLRWSLKIFSAGCSNRRTNTRVKGSGSPLMSSTDAKCVGSNWRGSMLLLYQSMSILSPPKIKSPPPSRTKVWRSLICDRLSLGTLAKTTTRASPRACAWKPSTSTTLASSRSSRP